MKIRAVIFDWAGTVVDYGCHAPAAVLSRIFNAQGVPLEPAESRHAMGLPKKDQIREILSLPRVREAWSAAHGAAPGERELDHLYEKFIPLQVDCIEEYSDVIDGVPELVEKLRSAGIRIGTTTGYTRGMIERVLPKAARQGFAPDAVLTPCDVGRGRPYPWMIFENLKRLEAYPPGDCVKVGDTAVDMEEGRNAGVVPVGVARSSSDAVVQGEERAAQILQAAGAHRVIGTAPELWSVLEQL